MEGDYKLQPKYDKMHQAVLEFIEKQGCQESDINPIGSFPLDERTYERFLMARDCDVGKAIDMIINCIKWRLERKPGHIKEDSVCFNTRQSWSNSTRSLQTC
jgi:hypothetical protein